MSRRKKLSALAEIHRGYHFRKAVEDEPGGAYMLLQPSSIDPNGYVDVEALPRVEEVSKRKDVMVDPYTVLFVAYGTNNRAYYFPNLPPNVAVSHTFYLLRPKYGVLNPGYLAWYLNQAPAQTYFEAMRGGVTVQTLRRDALGDLEIPVPLVDIQEQIAEVARLADEEEQIALALIERRRSLIHGFLLDKVTR